MSKRLALIISLAAAAAFSSPIASAQEWNGYGSYPAPVYRYSGHEYRERLRWEARREKERREEQRRERKRWEHSYREHEKWERHNHHDPYWNGYEYRDWRY